MDERYRSSNEDWDKLAKDYQGRQTDLRIYDESYDYTIHLLQSLKTARVLEMTAGLGHIAHYFLTKMPDLDYLATDSNEARLVDIGQRIKSIKTAKLDSFELGKLEFKFDLIIRDSELLSISRDQLNSFFEQAYAALKPKGYLYIRFDKEEESKNQNKKELFFQHKEEELVKVFRSIGFQVEKHFDLKTNYDKTSTGAKVIYILKK